MPLPLIRSHHGVTPRIAPSAFISETAVLIGDVHIADQAGIWYGAVLRGDVNRIQVGDRSNIQDGTVVHVATHGQGTYIGSDVTVGHSALLHACTVEDAAFIGMKACVMDNVRVETGAMVAAGSLVTPGKVVRSGELWGGSPARLIRKLEKEDYDMFRWLVKHYVELGNSYI